MMDGVIVPKLLTMESMTRVLMEVMSLVVKERREEDLEEKMMASAEIAER